MRRVVFAAVVFAVAAAGLATAQTVVRPIKPLPAPAPAAQPADAAQANLPPDPARLQQEVGALRSRVTRLEQQVDGLQSTLDAVDRRGRFTCVSREVSRNGDGVTENCAPYACNEMDGRCRTFPAAKSDHCAAGFAWNATNNQCTRG